MQTIWARPLLQALPFVAGLVCIAHADGQIFYPPRSSQTIYAYCYNSNTGGTIPNCNFDLAYGYWTYTNAHYHESPGHPSSSFSPSSGNTGPSGYAPVTINTTLIGQEEFVQVWNVDNPNDPGSELDFWVGYTDVYNSFSNLWIRIGGSDTGGDSGHGTTDYNHFQTQSASSGLYAATQQYLNAHAGVGQVCVNDMALPLGGKFDIQRTWTSPHIAHDRGTAVDVAGPGSGQCPAGNQVVLADFLQACIANGASATHSIPEGNHAHCNWADPATYPH
jgi:hypothetical protein